MRIFFFTELAFVLAKFSLLRLNKKQRNLPYVFSSKKLEINNWVVLAVQRQIISQMLVLRIIFQKSISYSYCIAPRKKLLFWLLLLISMRHDLNKNWKKGCIPKLKWLENVKLQSAASKRYSCPLSIHHPSNIEWTILWTVRLMETGEEIYCTFKHKG